MPEDATEKQGPKTTQDEVALDLMKFIAATTSIGKGTTVAAGFSGAAAQKPEDYASSLLELYTRCLKTIQGK